MEINKINLYNYHCKNKHVYSVSLLKNLDYGTCGIFVFEQLLLISMKYNDLKTCKYLYSVMRQTEYPWKRIISQIPHCNMGYKMIEFCEKYVYGTLYSTERMMKRNNYSKQNKWLCAKKLTVKISTKVPREQQLPYDDETLGFSVENMINTEHINIFSRMIKQSNFNEHEACDFLIQYFDKYGETLLPNVAMLCDKYDMDLYVHDGMICIQPKRIIGTFSDEECMSCCDNSDVITGCNHCVCLKCLKGCGMKCPYCRKYILHYVQKIE